MAQVLWDSSASVSVPVSVPEPDKSHQQWSKKLEQAGEKSKFIRNVDEVRKVALAVHAYIMQIVYFL